MKSCFSARRESETTQTLDAREMAVSSFDDSL